MAFDYSTLRDLFFSTDGDFRVAPNGDLEVTDSFEHRAFIQSILKRIMSSSGDWALQPELGANMADFIGKPNTRETGEALKNRVADELLRGGLVRAADLDVQVFPLSEHEVILLIVVRTTAEEPILIQFTYDLRNNRLIPRNI